MKRWTARVCAFVLLFPAQMFFPLPQARGQSRAAENPQTAHAEKLPVRRVVLYKNGVGYFEHLGQVRGSQDVVVSFTSGQLDDVLKSLTILDLGEGRITGVSYNSEAPLSRRLGALRLPVGEQTTVRQFLEALRGARLEARTAAGVVSGRLLSVERKTRISGGTTLEVDVVTLVTDAGELRPVELAPGLTLRVAERDLTEEIGRYLSLVASARNHDVRRMRISTAGTGTRPLYVSYISEVPVWKTTYRIVLPAKAGAAPLLQGWAIVDNTVGEDWENVELSLVAGAPQSFIQQLSQPYYSRRPVVPLPQAFQLTPQTHQAALFAGTAVLAGEVTDAQGAVISGARVRLLTEGGGLVAETQTDDLGDYEFENLAPGRYRVEVEFEGFKRNVYSSVAVAAGRENTLNARLELGTVNEVVVVESEAAQLNTIASYSISGAAQAPGGRIRTGEGWGGGIGDGMGKGAIQSLPLLTPGVVGEARARAQTDAAARELGDLFEYKLKQPVTVRKNESALVPIVHTPIEAEKVSLWSAANGVPRPLRALWLRNSSSLTLDGGSFTVLEGETFAGEGLLEPLRPGERRLLSYAVDLGVVVHARPESIPQRATRVRIVRGVMVHSRELRETHTYVVRNEDAAARAVLLEHPVRAGWSLAGDARPEEAAADVYRFRVSVEPQQTATLVVEERRPLDTRYELTNLDEKQIEVFVAQRSINAEIEQALRGIVAQKARAAALEERIEERQEEIERIFEDQVRLRENIKALGGSGGEKALLARYTGQLDEQESRLAALRGEVLALREQARQAQEELDRMLEQLALEATL